VPASDWSNWMRDLGREVRRLREFVGLSQERLARAAGVSQGAVSRLEAGRGLATPLLVAVRIRLALIEALRAVDPAFLSDELRQMLDGEHVVAFAVNGIRPDIAITRDRGLDEVIRLYRRLPERRREAAVALVRAAFEALAEQGTKNDDG
jgi:transcriptional regulator with XRE-family HTH domain